MEPPNEGRSFILSRNGGEYSEASSVTRLPYENNFVALEKARIVLQRFLASFSIFSIVCTEVSGVPAVRLPSQRIMLLWVVWLAKDCIHRSRTVVNRVCTLIGLRKVYS